MQTPLGLAGRQLRHLHAGGELDPQRAGHASTPSTPGRRSTMLQTGRQSGSTLNFNPLNVWTANMVNKGTASARGSTSTSPRKWFLGLFARYQEIDGNNDVSASDGLQHQRSTARVRRYSNARPATPRTPARFLRSTTPSSPIVSAWLQVPGRQALVRRPGPLASRTTRSTTPRPATRSTTCPHRSFCRRTTGTTRPGWAGLT